MKTGVYDFGDSPIDTSPAVANGVVYVGDWDGNVYALTASASSATLRWSKPTTNAQIFSSPAVANGRVYVGSYNNNVYAFNASTGEDIWEYETHNQTYSSPAVANGVVFIGGIDGNVYAIGNQTSGVQPVAVFTSDVRNGHAPLRVPFINQSTGHCTTDVCMGFQ